ncbi:MAG: hypothetical protein D6812_12880 [Deltaproteobacteria bacterium]|nr:MAG: hypothetical protein D6812_12880 [Deltaproteobacteria bacterium]
MTDVGLPSVGSRDTFRPFRSICSDAMRIPRIIGDFHAIALKKRMLDLRKISVIGFFLVASPLISM